MSEATPAVHVLNKMANFFVLKEAEGATLIDTGGKDRLENLERKFAALGLDLARLRRIVITHAHYDHTGSLAALRQAGSAKVLAHEQEVPFLTRTRRLPRPAGLAGFLFHVAEPIFRSPPLPVDQALRDGEVIAGAGLKVIHTPGHTPGHICLYHAGLRALFTGDALVSREGKLEGPVPFFSADISQARRSLQRLLELELETIYFAHGETLREGGGKALKELAAALSEKAGSGRQAGGREN